MFRICLMSYYGSLETIQLAENALKKSFAKCLKKMQIFNFPIFQNYNEHRNDYVDRTIEYLKNNQINYVLWWFINIPTKDFETIKNATETKYIFFNWDEPYNWNACDIVGKMPSIDYAYVTCQETLTTYKEHGCEAYCLYPGFDQSVNYPIADIDMDDFNKYSCDISFCCTNLYADESEYPDQWINRKKIIDTIYSNQEVFGYKFYIYGSKNLAELYPKSYRGFIKYNGLNKVFNYSKINLCTHVLCNKRGYLNERIFLIGGSGGLVLVDHVDGIENVFIPNEQIIIMDKKSYIKQIVDILDRYDEMIAVRKAFYKCCVEKFTYNHWGMVIAQTLSYNTFST
jgi:hypothetical protein